MTAALQPAAKDASPSVLSGALARNRSIAIGLAVLIVLLVIGAALVGNFLAAANLRSMLLLAAFLGLASLGQTLCALLGGLDLSIAYVIGAANILLPKLVNLGLPPVLAVVVVAIGGAVIGAVNGLLSFKLQGQALIVTLGVGFAVLGGAQILTSLGSSFAGTVYGAVPGWLSNMAAINGTTFGLHFPPIILVWLVISVALIVVMHRSWFGRSLYALGNSRLAASRLLISELKLWVAVYAISGLMAAITGVLLLGFSGGGFADVGNPYLFTTVAAVVIGGTSLLGGWGGYGATVIGTLVLTVLTTILVGIGLNYAAQQAVFGLLIVPVVALYARSPPIRMQI
jgi:ribose transport system permease protein